MPETERIVTLGWGYPLSATPFRNVTGGSRLGGRGRSWQQRADRRRRQVAFRPYAGKVDRPDFGRRRPRRTPQATATPT